MIQKDYQYKLQNIIKGMDRFFKNGRKKMYFRKFNWLDLLKIERRNNTFYQRIFLLTQQKLINYIQQTSTIISLSSFHFESEQSNSYTIIQKRRYLLLDQSHLINNLNKIMHRKVILGAGFLSSFLLSRDRNAQCCGIIGILSEKRNNIGQSLSMGVELLKNRGYDSAGIVTFAEEGGVVQQNLIKHAEQKNQTTNCIDRLIKQVSEKITRSHIGIGHTRWATCGQKVQRNAHPHYDQNKNVFIVHNGIIGGHAAIKKNYLGDVKFSSQTDTEVAAQLLGKFTAQGSTMLEAIAKTQKIIKQNSQNPQWGIVIMDKKQPHKMWTTTNGSPILIGMNEKQIFVASEIIAFQKQADFYFVTGDGETFQLQVSKIPQLMKKMQQAGRLKEITKKQKQGVQVKAPEEYKSFYNYEIHQQGSIEFKPEFERVKNLHFGPFLTLIACGSSMYAAMAAQYFFKKLNAFTKISIYDPVEMQENDIVPHETVVLISQSGQTKDLINVVQKCKSITDVSTIGVINVEGSTLARKVDFPIYIKVGRQVSVAATKSMFHQMLNLIMLAIEVATKKQTAKPQLLEQMKNELLLIPSFVTDLIKNCSESCEKVANLLWEKQSVYLLAMKEALAIARQAALKIKQLNYIHAEALGACEMKHGPIALIESDIPKKTPVILFILDNDTFQQCTNAFDQMNSRNALVIIVTDCKQKIIKHYQTKKKKEIQKKLSESPEKKHELEQEIKKQESPDNRFTFLSVPKLKHFSSLLCLIPLQIVVQKISILKKIDPDMPRNLAKTVTV